MRKMFITFLAVVLCLSSVAVVFATQPKAGADSSQLNYCKEGVDNVTDCVMPIDDTYCVEDDYEKCMPVDNCIGNRLLNCIMPPEPYTKYVFEDVWDEDAWYFHTIYDVYAKNLMQGYPNGYFGLGEELTWVQTVALAVRTEHFMTGKVYTQKYEKPEYWYSEDIANALEGGIITKVPADVNAPISRGEMAIIFSKVIPRFTDFVGQVEPTEKEMEQVTYNDLVGVDSEVSNAVNSLKDMGIVNGKSEFYFGVNDTLKREEIATIISRMTDIMMIDR